MDQLPRLGKRELICLLLFTCNYVVFVWRGFLFLWVLGMGYVILLWHSLSLPYNYFTYMDKEMFLPLFNTLIRPHLEYATVVWSPFLKKDIFLIENVQRRATKIVKKPLVIRATKKD